MIKGKERETRRQRKGGERKRHRRRGTSAVAAERRDEADGEAPAAVCCREGRKAVAVAETGLAGWLSERGGGSGKGEAVGVWRRWRESFLQLHFRSAFCSERERDTHRILPPPPPPPARYRLTVPKLPPLPRSHTLTRTEGEAVAVAAGQWQRPPGSVCVSEPVLPGPC
ncbi:hypothetical protein KIL84_014033 [Mauremys mutica]|uniref:Uncharacterized protein n=1 Tax=Mauremys mutica TaxID=74926 RepID=A0A9D3WZ18_9SAUR|nr:hypothetical protein KIL84_014033 [Mauremys mutica]